MNLIQLGLYGFAFAGLIMALGYAWRSQKVRKVSPADHALAWYCSGIAISAFIATIGVAVIGFGADPTNPQVIKVGFNIVAVAGIGVGATYLGQYRLLGYQHLGDSTIRGHSLFLAVAAAIAGVAVAIIGSGFADQLVRFLAA